MTNNTPKSVEEIKTWFEQNYLDGDAIQAGQMLSSETCFEAITQIRKEAVEETVKKILDNVDDETRQDLESYTFIQQTLTNPNTKEVWQTQNNEKQK